MKEGNIEIRLCDKKQDLGSGKTSVIYDIVSISFSDVNYVRLYMLPSSLVFVVSVVILLTCSLLTLVI